MSRKLLPWSSWVSITALIATSLAFGLPGSVRADEAATAAEDGSDNVRHVANVAFPDRRVEGASSRAQATDSDFVEFTIPAGDELSTACRKAQEAGRPGPPKCAAEVAAGWSLPSPEENGGVELPHGYAPQPGEERVFNMMGTYDNGMWITDVTDPENPVIVSRWDCGVLQADVFSFEQTDDVTGEVRTYVSYSLDATSDVLQETECAQTLGVPTGVSGTFIAEVTDPYRPRSVSFLPMKKGSHQTTVHPSGDYIYNSAAVVVTTEPGSIEVYDVSDPADPQLVNDLPLLTGLDSHDMTFNEDGTRLYSAALTHSFVIDTTDPANPAVIGRVIDPTVNIHHDAHAVTVETPLGERTFMLIGDELAGAAGNGFCPGGGIHVYDITGDLEALPVKVGAFFIPDLRPAGLGDDATGESLTCTAHVIQILPEQQLLVMAWYNAGVRVLDYSGLADLSGAGVGLGAGNESITPGIQQVGWHRFTDTDLWSAHVQEVADDGSFFIFGGDTVRALDIWEFDPNAGGDVEADETGTWMAADELSADAVDDLASQGLTLDSGYRPYCLINR